MNTPKTQYWRNVANHGRGAEMTKALHDACDEISKLETQVQELSAENVQLRRLIDKGRESTATELGLSAQVEMYRDGAAKLFGQVAELREALESIKGCADALVGLQPNLAQMNKICAISSLARAILEKTK